MFLIQLLQSPDIREARRVLFTAAEDRPFGDWTPGEIEECQRAVNAYDIAGIMIREEMVPERPILSSWGGSISRVWRAAGPLVEARRHSHGAKYWDDIEWLYERVATYWSPPDENGPARVGPFAARPFNAG